MKSRNFLLIILCAFFAHLSYSHALAPVPSQTTLTTGNGFGFSVFDLTQNKITEFLERPYRYLSPGATQQDTGVERRNLAYDVYFGVRAVVTASPSPTTYAGWLKDAPQAGAGYVNQSNVMRSVANVGPLSAESYFVAPFGYAGNMLLGVVQVTNTGNTPVTVDAFANPNFHMGSGTGDTVGTDGEVINTNGGYAVETGNGAGAMVYLPFTASGAGFDHADCSGTGYARVMAGQDLLGTPTNCSGSDITIEFQKSLGVLQPGQKANFALAIGFAADANSTAAETALATFIAGRDGLTVINSIESEFESWRKPPPSSLSSTETALWRQQEAVLRMAQVREPWQLSPKQKGLGMILASLPPGQWHIGWVRDAQYSIVALARMGHFAEAKAALTFFLNAEANTYESYVGVPYQLSVVRYFGDGQEESDWNSDGPNIELDGFGLYLWAAKTYVALSGDTAWLSETLYSGQRVWDVIGSGIAAPLLHNVDSDRKRGASGTGTLLPDTSIWESHWNDRAHFPYSTLAAARGFCDLGWLTERAPSPAPAISATAWAFTSRGLTEAARAHMVDSMLYLGGSIEGLQSGKYHDGATLEAINWGLYPSDPLNLATVAGLSTLQVSSGGYMRNDNNLSSYDSNEWVFIDLRAASAMRQLGQTAAAETLIGWVTSQGAANQNLLPELFNTDSGAGADRLVHRGHSHGRLRRGQLDLGGARSDGAHCRGRLHQRYAFRRQRRRQRRRGRWLGDARASCERLLLPIVAVINIALEWRRRQQRVRAALRRVARARRATLGAPSVSHAPRPWPSCCARMRRRSRSSAPG